MKNFLFLLSISLLFIILYSCSNNEKVGNQSEFSKDSLFKSFPILDSFAKKECKIVGRENLISFCSIEYPKVIKDSSVNNWILRIEVKKDGIKICDTSLKYHSRDSLIFGIYRFTKKAPYKSPRNASYEFKNDAFSAIPPEEGTKIDSAKFVSFLLNIPLEKLDAVDLERQKLYEEPKFDLDAKETKDAKIALDKCLNSIIVLTHERFSFKIEQKDFAKWIYLNQNMKVDFDLFQMQDFLQNIAQKVEIPLVKILDSIKTFDSTAIANFPKFKRVNINAMINELVDLIPKGVSSSKSIVFSNRGLPRGLGKGFKDFVEISISDQMLWLFKNGQLIIETDVVTGNKRLGRNTPVGNFSIKNKARNTVLRGPNYAAFVSYWMPFIGGYGLHDSSWRRRFGSNLYENGGSHGCVNLPPKNTPLIYSNVEIGTPVIIY